MPAEQRPWQAVPAIAGGLVLLAGLCAFSVLFRTDGLPPQMLRVVLRNVRIPRTAAAALCGAGLSVSGLLLQSALNNTLAGPGIIGINSGAGLFVLVAALLFPYSAPVSAGGAFAGALLSLGIVYAVSAGAGSSKTALVLAGVAVSSLMGAGIDIIMTVHPEIIADKVAFNLGGFQNLAPSQIAVAAPVITAGTAFALLLAPGIELLQLGDEAAFALGLRVRAHRLLTVITASLLAAACVSVCGLLGFVGLIVPNIVRLFAGGRCRLCVCACAVWGGAFLLLCDILARTLFFPYEIPVGLFLSCLGAPFFISLLIRRRRKLEL